MADQDFQTVGKELPPRTRRIHDGSIIHSPNYGTTSAYAENTWAGYRALHQWGNYLRVRGEYTHDIFVIPRAVELPPRTRRIRRLHPPR